jgi:4-amino-4-deoxy-L-arabinose transferase-like glycosyltransferase
LFLSSLRRWIVVALAGLAGWVLYLFGLTRCGLLSADEPRYAAIGRAMAATGDWITPRLWGQPWFEKPALLYWMTAAGFKLGLDQDLAPRLPLALASIAFLIFFWCWLRGQFGPRVAWYASAILATSVGWLAYSRVAVTDLPLAACFSACMMLAISGAAPVAGVFLGLAVLAKGLVPLVLFLPAVWYFRRQPGRLAWILGVAVLVAAPWYVLVTLRNGTAFLDEFIVKHHFARFASGALQHERPFWFYAPVLLAAIFPWIALIVELFRKSLYRGWRERLLLAWVVFGFAFFSASRNKLPGYLLPLMPALAILLGIALTQTRRAGWMMAISGALLGLIPAAADALPQALASGASHAQLQPRYWIVAPAILFGALLWRLDAVGRRDWAVGAVAGAMTALVAGVIWVTYPVLDQSVSARGYWRSHPVTCSDNKNRGWRYGLDYYAGKVVPDCNHSP